jgi:DNA-binding transcriptional ArsR family regulator
LPGTQKQIETLEAQVADLTERLALIETEVRSGADAEADPSAPPARSLRRATSRRASKRRAQARALKPDTKARIVEYLGKHPGSTAGQVAKALDANRSTVSSSLAQLVTLGRVRRDEQGYVAD